MSNSKKNWHQTPPPPHYQIYLFFAQIHVHGYMDLKKKQNSTYMNLREEKNLIMRGGRGGLEKLFFGNLTHFFDIQFKNTFNLILLSFKVPSERFFHKNFKTGLTFWNMWFKKIENWVGSCPHLGGTPCNWGPSNIYRHFSIVLLFI